MADKILRVLFLLAAFAAQAGSVHAQPAGSADPAWTVLRRGPAPAGAGSWQDIATQADGRLLVSSNAFGERSVLRFTHAGLPDPSFSNDGVFPLPSEMGAPTLEIDPNGRIYLYAGTATQRWVDGRRLTETSLAITRLTEDGALDTSFGDGAELRLPISASYNDDGPEYDETWLEQRFATAVIDFSRTRLLHDGSFLLVGTAVEEGRPTGETALIAARLLANGQVDASFGTNGLVLRRFGHSISTVDIEVWPDGSFALAVWETTDGNQNTIERYVLKFTANGTADASFGANGIVSAGTSTSVEQLALEPSGKLLVAAERDSNVLVARLEANGTLDPGFGSGGMTNAGAGALHGLEVQADGRAVLALTRIGVGPTLARLGVDGAIDAQFVSEPIDDFTIEAGLLAVGARGAFVVSASTHQDQRISRAIRKLLLEPRANAGSLSTGQEPSVSGFLVEVHDSVLGIPYDTARITRALSINGYVFPQAADVNAVADVFVVAASPRGLFMRNGAGNFVPWSGRFSEVLPAYEDLTLTSAMHVPIYTGQLPFTGSYRLYLGYMRNGGPLIYIDEPTLLDVIP